MYETSWKLFLKIMYMQWRSFLLEFFYLKYKSFKCKDNIRESVGLIQEAVVKEEREAGERGRNGHTFPGKIVNVVKGLRAYLVAMRGQVMLGEAQASGLQGAHSYSLSSRPETAPKTLRHPPVQPPARPKPLPAPREVLALLPAPSSLLSLLARPFCNHAAINEWIFKLRSLWRGRKINTPQTLSREKERGRFSSRENIRGTRKNLKI